MHTKCLKECFNGKKHIQILEFQGAVGWLVLATCDGDKEMPPAGQEPKGGSCNILGILGGRGRPKC